jgi:hypothetical protein
VARDKKHKKHVAPTGPVLKARVEKALTEHRTQQALDLAKTLFRQEATPANRDLLKRASMARVRDLSSQAHYRDAAVILNNLTTLDGTPEFLVEIAQQLADCGDLARALEVRGKLTESALQAKVMTHVADEVLRQGETAKQNLPAELHGQLELIRRAVVRGE